MRISSNLLFQTGLNSMNAQQSDLMRLFQQIGSGQRMVTPADDPLAAAQAINLRQSEALNLRLGDNRHVAMQNLGAEDNTLSSVVMLMQDIKTTMIEAGNGTMSDADRMTLSTVLTSARDNLLSLANATDGNGQFLFSGSHGNVKPFDVSGVYSGDSLQRNIQIDQTRQLASSDVGTDIFNRASPGSTNYVSSAAKSNNGTGLISTPVITNAAEVKPGYAYEIEFTSDDGDYQVNVIPADGAPPITGTIDLTENNHQIKIPGYGLQAKFSGKPLTGDSFSVQPVEGPSYLATSSLGNTSVDAAISMPVVTNAAAIKAGYVYEITFDDPLDLNAFTVTVTPPVTIPVTPTPASFTGSIDGSGNDQSIQIIDLDSVPNIDYGLQINFSGTPDLNDTFTVQQAVSSSDDLNVFQTLQTMIDALAAPQGTGSAEDQAKANASFQNILASSMQRLDLNYNNVLTVQSSVGARMNEIDAVTANGSMRYIALKGEISRLEDLDYYSASSQLQLRNSALEAAMMAFVKIQKTTMLNMSGR